MLQLNTSSPTHPPTNYIPQRNWGPTGARESSENNNSKEMLLTCHKEEEKKANPANVMQ